jgi:hypothetical protein
MNTWIDEETPRIALDGSPFAWHLPATATCIGGAQWCDCGRLYFFCPLGETPKRKVEGYRRGTLRLAWGVKDQRGEQA